MDSVARRLPVPIDVAKISHPVLRNAAINQSYYEFGDALLTSLGGSYLSNWFLYGQFASHQIGQWIRDLTASGRTVIDFLTLPVRADEGAIDRAIKDLVVLPEKFALFQPLWNLAQRRAGVRELEWSWFLRSHGWRAATQRLRGLLSAWKLLFRSLGFLRQAFIEGNQRIYQSIAPAIHRFLQTIENAQARDGKLEDITFSAEQDPSGFLREGVALYREVYALRDAANDADPRRESLRQAIMHRANLLLGCQEQLLILQPSFELIREEMQAMSSTMALEDPLGSYKLLPNGGDWGDFYTRMGMLAPRETDALTADAMLGLQLPPENPSAAGTIGEYFRLRLTEPRLHRPVDDIFPLGRNGDAECAEEDPFAAQGFADRRTFWDTQLEPQENAQR